MMRLMRLIPGLRKSRICCGSQVKRVLTNTVTLNEVQGEVPSAEEGHDVDRGADRRRQGYDVSW